MSTPPADPSVNSADPSVNPADPSVSRADPSRRGTVLLAAALGLVGLALLVLAVVLAIR